MLKTINLEDGNRIMLSIEPGYCTNTVSISKGYFCDDELVKDISLTIWDDIAFHGYICSQERNIEYPKELVFEFDINDPIYFCLLELLGNDDYLVIDDDDTYDILKKYMTVKREETSIKIIFTNLKEENFYHNRYGAFIKNIGPDGRSKIEDINIKYRIVDFFGKLVRTLLEEYHQVTIPEYLEINRIKKLQENSKLIRKK